MADEQQYTGGMTPFVECSNDGVRFTLTTMEGKMLFTWTMDHSQALDLGSLLTHSVDEWYQEEKCQEG